MPYVSVSMPFSGLRGLRHDGRWACEDEPHVSMPFSGLRGLRHVEDGDLQHLCHVSMPFSGLRGLRRGFWAAVAVDRVVEGLNALQRAEGSAPNAG